MSAEIEYPEGSIRVLDKGFVRLVDSMGTDESITQAARVSYGKGTKKVEEEEGLIRYLMRHRHCYHPTMEVLTSEGWKRWDQCSDRENFLVPDPESRSLVEETLDVKCFDFSGNLFCFENDRMSYAVTPEHRMLFKAKYEGEFKVIPANQMSKWGHFEPLRGYEYHPFVGECDPEYEFIGFFLGDGSYSSKNTVSFHLKKGRKKDYLMRLSEDLGLHPKITRSSTYDDALVFLFSTPEFLRNSLPELSSRSRDKRFPREELRNLDGPKIRGLWNGLVNSDGSVKKDRPQVSYSSNSLELLKLFQVLSAMLGMDCHATSTPDRVTAYQGGRTSLESRAQFHFQKHYTGKVFCATTSTGLLVVRGAEDKFAFVCGNSTPFEMCQFKFHIKAPLFIFRQWHRHRMWSYNEYSGRYSEMKDEFYVPLPEHVTFQNPSNKQGGTSEAITPLNIKNPDDWWDLMSPEDMMPLWDWQKTFSDEQSMIRAQYEKYLGTGMRKELARINLPLANYSEMYASVDLHNLFHFLKLRLDSHAQYEIRVYAQALYDLIKPVVPIACKAFDDYILNSTSLTALDHKCLRYVIDIMKNSKPSHDRDNWSNEDLDGLLHSQANSVFSNKREREEFIVKASKLLFYFPETDSNPND